MFFSPFPFVQTIPCGHLPYMANYVPNVTVIYLHPWWSCHHCQYPKTLIHYHWLDVLLPEGRPFERRHTRLVQVNQLQVNTTHLQKYSFDNLLSPTNKKHFVLSTPSWSIGILIPKNMYVFQFPLDLQEWGWPREWERLWEVGGTSVQVFDSSWNFSWKQDWFTLGTLTTWELGLRDGSRLTWDLKVVLIETRTQKK